MSVPVTFYPWWPEEAGISITSWFADWADWRSKTADYGPGVFMGDIIDEAVGVSGPRVVSVDHRTLTVDWGSA